MRNSALQKIDALIGPWTLRLWDAWFLEPSGTEVHGWARFEWLGDAFVIMRSGFGDDPGHDLAIGHDDASDSYVALYHDERGVSRLFRMTFEQGQWTMTRQDPDFHQRFIADVTDDRIEGRWEASEDGGHAWRKDYNLTFQRQRAS